MSVSVFSMIFKLFIFMHVFSPWQSLSKLTLPIWLTKTLVFLQQIIIFNYQLSILNYSISGHPSSVHFIFFCTSTEAPLSAIL